MTPARWIVGLLILLAAAIAVALSAARPDPEKAALRAALRAQTVQTGKWRARYAQAATHVTTKVDTVRVRVTKYQTLRDSLTVTDTVLIAAADSAIAECVNLATACEVLRTRADSTISMLTIERDGWRRLYETTHHPRCGKKCWFTIGVLATVGAAVAVRQLETVGMQGQR